MKILDKKGVWVRSSAKFGFVNPDTGQFIEPGEEMQVTDSGWLDLQAAFIERIKSPLEDDDEAPKKAEK